MVTEILVNIDFTITYMPIPETQCRFIINEVKMHSSERTFTIIPQSSINQISLKTVYLKYTPDLPEANEMKLIFSQIWLLWTSIIRISVINHWSSLENYLISNILQMHVLLSDTFHQHVTDENDNNFMVVPDTSNKKLVPDHCALCQ